MSVKNCTYGLQNDLKQRESVRVYSDD